MKHLFQGIKTTWPWGSKYSQPLSLDSVSVGAGEAGLHTSPLPGVLSESLILSLRNANMFN